MQTNNINRFIPWFFLYSFYVCGNSSFAASDVSSRPAIVSIMQIQGDSQFSDYANELIETTGVVTVYNKKGSSFWMQDPSGDGSTATSDGIYVSGGGFPKKGVKPKPGDLIRIVAKVQEQKFASSLPLTRLRKVNLIEILSENNTLPEPVKLYELPSESIESGILFWESLEGMLVQIDDAKVVAATSRFGEFTIISKANRKLESGYFSGYYQDSGQLLIRSIGEQRIDYNPERILVDDGSLQDPIITEPGDEIKMLVGVVDYTFSNYKIQPVSFKLDDDSELNQKAGKDKKPSDKKKHQLSVASFNVENLFDLTNNPDKKDKRSTPTAKALNIKLSKLALAIQTKLANPDILIVQEIENTEILQTLADMINSQSHTQYDSSSFETSDVRGIEVGFMWNKQRVELKTAFQMSSAAVEQAFGPNSISPGREPLVGIFNFDDVEITIIGNHFKSKGGDDPIYGLNQPPIRKTETQRKLQAMAVREYIDTLLQIDPDANIIVAGDFNDFQFAEPGEGANHTLAILEGSRGDIAMYNLINDVKAAFRFTYVFDGNSQALDHMLVSPALLQHTKKIKIPHFNTSAAAMLSSNPDTARRSSDHDPLLATFDFK